MMKTIIILISVCVSLNALHVEHEGAIFPTGKV